MTEHKSPKTNYDIIAIAASAGGLKALIQIVSQLPKNFPVTILVVQHLAPQHKSMLAEILSQYTVLTVKQAVAGEKVRKSTIYLAPPNYHLLVTGDQTLDLTQSELVHFVRPSADVLFQSVAEIYQERAIAVVLTGTGSDGSMGVKAIKNRGGIVIAQNEATCEHFGMPETAIKTGVVDYILPLEEISPHLISLIREQNNDQ